MQLADEINEQKYNSANDRLKEQHDDYALECLNRLEQRKTLKAMLWYYFYNQY